MPEIQPDQTPYDRYAEDGVPFLSRLLSYGIWSGPGYVAGHYSIPIALLRKGQSETAHIRNFRGIDAYDHFVARSHDLNEVDAELNLAHSLEAAGIVSFTDREIAYRDAAGKETKGTFASPPELARGGIGGDRFVDVVDYIGRSNAEHKPAVVEACCQYLLHLAYSNLQFIVDMIPNKVDRTQPRGGWMGLQYLGAGPIFQKEASDLFAAVKILQSDHEAPQDLTIIRQQISRFEFNYAASAAMSGPIARNKDRLVWTFNPRELLFRFEDADVDLFRRDLWAVHSPVIGQSGFDERLRQLALATNQRSDPDDIPG